jgi:hypothetical protein
MRNKYQGICYRCGKTVMPGEGHFEKIKNGGWNVQHAECAIEYRRRQSDNKDNTGGTHESV